MTAGRSAGARTRIKICGITREQDLEAALALGVDAVGFVFYPLSARYLTPARAAVLLKQLPPFVSTVGLFVNASIKTIAETLDQVPLSCLQFHGDESPEYCLAINNTHHLPIIRAARVHADLNLPQFAEQFVGQAGCAGLLLDAWNDRYGGAGRTFDWSLIPPAWCTGEGPPFALSGGLDSENVAQAISVIRPYAVDVSSGVEGEQKGIKDLQRMREFVAAVQTADLSARLA